MKFAHDDKKQDMEAIVGETLEEYNAKAEKSGMKNFIISFPPNQDSDESDDDNSFSIEIQREVMQYGKADANGHTNPPNTKFI